MPLYTMYCRLYQGIFKLVSPLLGWREPELLEGAGSLRRLPALLGRLGIQRLLLVTDQSLIRLGLADRLLADLEADGILAVVYDQALPNPTIDIIEAGVRAYQTGQCQALVAFGGGSPIDCAKGIGARLARPGKSLADMKGVLRVRRALPPLVAIPTTAGTGSEATLAAVVVDAKTHEKYPINDHVLIPQYAVLDPELCLGLPPALTATTGMDALTHAIEAFIGRSNTAATEADAAEATRLLMGHLVPVYRDGGVLEGRARLLKAAYLAGKAFTRAYVGNVHAIAHALGGLYGLAHGLANAVILPHVLDYYGIAAHRRLAQLALRAGLAQGFDPMDHRAIAIDFIQRIKDMNTAMGIPSQLPEIRPEDIPAMVGRALAEANPLYPVPLILNRRMMTEIFQTLASQPGLSSRSNS